MLRFIFISLSLFLAASCNKIEEPQQTPADKILLLTKTSGYRHESIETGLTMFQAKASEWNINFISSDQIPSKLSDYKMIVLLNTTGDLFSASEEIAVQDFVRKGGAILGIHAAADAEYYWPWYGKMLGGWFLNHPEVQQARCSVVGSNHPAIKGLPAVWLRTDEWYNFQQLQTDNTVLVTIDESSYSGGANGANHPVSWCREFEGGRIFYTAMGHTSVTYSEPLFQQHIGGAIQWLLKR